MNPNDFYKDNDELSAELKPEFDRIDKSRKLIEAFMECNTTGEVRNLCQRNLYFMADNPALFLFARNARNRIRLIHQEMLDSYKLQLS
jgi:hypothetical protein